MDAELLLGFGSIIDFEEGDKMNDAISRPPVKQEPCEDAISRQAVLEAIEELKKIHFDRVVVLNKVCDRVSELPPVTPQPNMGHCKDCKYFEYDTLAKVNGIKLIVAHEICKRWGDGCQSKEDGYCFLFEPKTQEVEE